MTSPKSKEAEVLGAERRRRWSAAEKVSMVRETYEPGMTVSLVARRHGINPNQLFHWRKLERIGALTAVEAGETVVPAAELEVARRQIRELQRLLGKKAFEVEILKEAVEVARERKWIARSPLLPGDDR
jgi:transposase